jgi:CreA protein
MIERPRAVSFAAFVLAGTLGALSGSRAGAADESDLIFKRVDRLQVAHPDDKLATYGLDDPEVEGVACHFTVPEKGGLKGWIGVAEEVSDISLACRQVGPIRFKKKFQQGEDVFRARRSLFFKKMQIVRGCDTKRNVLVYMVYSDKIIEGSPKNSTSSVPVMPWGNGDEAQKCADWVEAGRSLAHTKEATTTIVDKVKLVVVHRDSPDIETDLGTYPSKDAAMPAFQDAIA